METSAPRRRNPLVAIIYLSNLLLVLCQARHEEFPLTDGICSGAKFCSTTSENKSAESQQMLSNSFCLVERGELFADNYFMYFCTPQIGYISPVHDIPFRAAGGTHIYNMVVEVPRWTNAKMEMIMTERLNPIRQDTKDGKPRYVANVFPYKGYIWNYGALTQTWEDPNHVDPHTNAKGDNDPIDACEIGSRVARQGEVLRVKILGSFALIDEGETDWKLLTVNVEDPLADKLNDIDDIEREMPGLLSATHEWFKIYKIPEGKPFNQFAFGGKPKNREFSTSTAEETHVFWQQLHVRSGELAGDSSSGRVIAIDNAGVEGSPGKIEEKLRTEIVESKDSSGPAVKPPPGISSWHYVPTFI